jgi:hypothetical protein
LIALSIQSVHLNEALFRLERIPALRLLCYFSRQRPHFINLWPWICSWYQSSRLSIVRNW